MVLALTSLSLSLAHANERVQGWCEQGGYPVLTVGVLPSTTLVQRSFPVCTITVYAAGTTNPVSIFSDSGGTALSNPFTADRTGHWFFYVANGHYDINLSGAGIPAPFTIGDVLAFDPSGGATSVTSFNGRIGAVVPESGDYDYEQIANRPTLTPDFYNFTSQTPNIAMTGGVAATLPMSPCPLGVNGSDGAHYYWISGGTGTAEAVLGTGGTCVSGAASGTLIVLPLNNHSGAYTISSATSGIQEAFLWAQTNEPTPVEVLLKAEDYLLHAQITIPLPINSPGHWNAWVLAGASKMTSRLLVDPTFCGMSQTSGPNTCAIAYNGVINVSQNSFPAPTFENFAIILPQPFVCASSSDCNPQHNFNQWPPAIFIDGGPQGNIFHLYISGAWVGLHIYGHWNGSGFSYDASQWNIDDINISAYSIGADFDGSFDVNKISHFHFWPYTNIVGATLAQQSPFFDPSVIGFRVAEQTGFYLSNGYLIQGGPGVQFAKGHNVIGDDLIHLTNIGFDFNSRIDMTQATAVVQAAHLTFFSGPVGITNQDCPAPSLDIENPNGGRFTGTDLRFNSGCAAHVAAYFNFTGGASPLFESYSITDSDFVDTVMSTIAPPLVQMDGTTVYNVHLTNNRFGYLDQVAHALAAIQVNGANVRLIATDNSVLPASGTGILISIAADNYHVIADNSLPLGWEILVPPVRRFGIYQNATFSFQKPTLTATFTHTDSPVTLSLSATTLFCDATGGVVQFNLQPAANGTGQPVVITKIDSSANQCSLVPFAGDTINGTSSLSNSTQYLPMRIKSDGITHWFNF